MKLKIAPARWHRLMPLIFITYSLAYLDRANFGFAVAGKMTEDLNISAATSSFLGSLFFLGYFCFQIPGGHYAAKRSAKKLIFWSLLVWGILASATGLISNINALMVIRFMLGVGESSVVPAILILLSRWFTKSERSKANTLFMLGQPTTVVWMSILSGYLVSALGWRLMFIWEGLPAIIWAFLWWHLVDDRPRNAKWLTDQEKNEFEEHLEKEQAKILPIKNYAAAFKSRAVILLCLHFGFWGIGMMGFVMWLPSIIKAEPGIDMVSTGWLSSVPYLFAVIGMLITSYFSDKVLKRKIFVWPILMLASGAFLCSYLVGTSNFWLSYSLLIIGGAAMYSPYGPFFAIIPEILPSNVLGGAMALINSFGALGSFAGAYVVGRLNASTGGFGASYLFMASCVFVSAVLMLFAVKNEVKTVEC
ncbi:MAG: MFS transporter [Bacteroidota bacterium]